MRKSFSTTNLVDAVNGQLEIMGRIAVVGNRYRPAFPLGFGSIQDVVSAAPNGTTTLISIRGSAFILRLACIMAWPKKFSFCDSKHCSRLKPHIRNCSPIKPQPHYQERSGLTFPNCLAIHRIRLRWRWCVMQPCVVPVRRGAENHLS